MQLSANYNLQLPEGADNVKRQDFVDNFTAIDTHMKVINDNSYPNVTATGTNSYEGSTDRIKSLGKGTKLTLFVGTDATGNCCLKLNSYGYRNIKDSFGNIVTNLKANIPYNLCCNGTDFILQGKGGGGDATASQVLSGKKVTVDGGPMVGTMPNNGALNKALSINGTYTIPAGYTSGGSVTQSIPTKAAATITPGVTAQTIAANQYLLGDQVIAGDANLIPSNIISTANIFGVQGTFTGMDFNYCVFEELTYTIKNATKSMASSSTINFDIAGVSTPVNVIGSYGSVSSYNFIFPKTIKMKIYTTTSTGDDYGFMTIRFPNFTMSITGGVHSHTHNNEETQVIDINRVSAGIESNIADLNNNNITVVPNAETGYNGKTVLIAVVY